MLQFLCICILYKLHDDTNMKIQYVCTSEVKLEVVLFVVTC